MSFLFIPRLSLDYPYVIPCLSPVATGRVLVVTRFYGYSGSKGKEQKKVYGRWLIHFVCYISIRATNKFCPLRREWRSHQTAHQKDERRTAGAIRGKAEVFTPSWVCNCQNNLVDDAWFGYAGAKRLKKGSGGKYPAALSR